MRAIFDASVFVRALADVEPASARWVDRALNEIAVSVPSLVFAEVGNALAGYVRATRLPAKGALDDAVLVTADRGLAAAVTRAELV